MSEALIGAKSTKYDLSQVPTAQVDTKDSLKHVTAQEIPGERVGLDVIQNGFFLLTDSLVIAGGAQKLLNIVGHGAKKGDILKITSGASIDAQISIIGIEDANNLYISTPINVAIADTCQIYRSVSAQYARDGSLNVTAVQGPIKIKVDGVATEVSIDTVTPVNTVPIPVEITGTAGPINITAGDLNVQLSDQGANPDVTRIGDGTNQWGINASSEGLIHDADALAQLVLLVAKDFATSAKQDTGNTSLATIAGKDFATQTTLAALLTELQLKADLTDTQPVSVQSSALPTGAATSAKQDAQSALIGDLVEAAPASDTASSGLNGRLQRIAQRITSLIALFPTALGQSTMANSFRVVLASDQSAIPTTPTKNYITGTLKTAQITVGTSQVRATTDNLAPSAARNLLKIKPSKNNTGAIYLIATGGSTSTGMEIIGPDTLSFEYDPTDYYLISDTSAQTVEIVEVE